MKKIRIFPLLLIVCLLFATAAPAAYALDDPELNGQAALVVDLDTGSILYELNKDQVRAPASLTKVMTMLVALEAMEAGQFTLDDIVTAGDDCLTGLASDSSNAGIQPGVQLSVKDLFYCVMLASANEGCNVLASFVSGSIDNFVSAMNQKAAELGCTNTHFMNPNGLPATDHYTTAYDLYIITKAALEYPLFVELMNTASYQSSNTAVNSGSVMYNSNALISPNSYYAKDGAHNYIYEGASGVKTGYTNAAGYCLISTAERNGINVMAIAMGCQGEQNGDTENFWNFIDSITMYDWVFDNFSHRTILSVTENITSVAVDLSDEGSVLLHPESSITMLLPNDVSDDDIERTVTIYDDELVAPIAAGTVLGEISLSLDGEELGTVQLVNNSEVSLSKIEYMKQQLAAFFAKGWVITVIVLVALFLFVYLALVVRYRRLRQKHLRERRRAEQRRRMEQERHRQEARSYRMDSTHRESGDFDFDRYFDDK